MKVVIRIFLDKYMKHASIPDELFWKLTGEEYRGQTVCEISQHNYDQVVATYEKSQQKEKLLYHTAELNNKGAEAERAGKIKSAIAVYEKNIESDYPAHHSYKRLMVLYRKNKDFENEIRVIKRALCIFHNENEYEQRLDKAEELLTKKNNL